MQLFGKLIIFGVWKELYHISSWIWWTDIKFLLIISEIKNAEYSIPDDGRVSEDTKTLIRKLLTTNSRERMTANQVKDALESIIAIWKSISGMNWVYVKKFTISKKLYEFSMYLFVIVWALKNIKC